METKLFKKMENEGYYPVSFWNKKEDSRGFEDAPFSEFAVKCSGYTEDEEGEKHPSDFSIVVYFDKNGNELGDNGWN